jgi:glycosyl transferase family 1
MRSLIDLGHTIHIVATSDETADPILPDPVTFERLTPPRTGRVIANIIRYATTARFSLNECLYWSPTVAEAVKRIAAEQRADFLVADTLRAFPLAAATGFPVVADLDDLLSCRYRSIRNAPGSSQGIALGSYGMRLPAFARPVATRAATAALDIESRLIARREIQIARQAAAVCLVSSKESAKLEKAAGVKVFWTPPVIPVLDETPVVSDAPDWNAVYVGGLDFGPNIQAVRWFRTEVIPWLQEPSRGTFRLSVIGHCPPKLQRELQHPVIDLHGYVDRLEPFLARARVFVAPVVSGTGLKIKVLDAMARGMPVVGTSKAFEGFPVQDRVHAHVADTPADFARRLEEVALGGKQAAELGKAGQALVATHFSARRAAAGWQSVTASVADFSAVTRRLKMHPENYGSEIDLAEAENERMRSVA